MFSKRPKWSQMTNKEWIEKQYAVLQLLWELRSSIVALLVILEIDPDEFDCRKEETLNKMIDKVRERRKEI